MDVDDVYDDMTQCGLIMKMTAITSKNCVWILKSVCAFFASPNK